MCFTVLSVFCIVLCCRHWASFPRCRKSVAILFLKPGQMERFKSHPPCKEVGIGVGVSLGSSCCKAGAQLLSPAEQRLPYSPPPPHPFALISFQPFLSFSFSDSFFMCANTKDQEWVSVCLQNSPVVVILEIPLHLPHVWGSATMWLMIVLCLTCCWIFLKNTFFIFN